MRDSGFLNHVVEDVTQDGFELLGEVVVKVGGENLLAGSVVGNAAISGNRVGFAADSEAYDERPDQHPDIEFGLMNDDFTHTREVADKLCRR